MIYFSSPSTSTVELDWFLVSSVVLVGSLLESTSLAGVVSASGLSVVLSINSLLGSSVVLPVNSTSGLGFSSVDSVSDSSC